MDWECSSKMFILSLSSTIRLGHSRVMHFESWGKEALITPMFLIGNYVLR